MVICQHDGERVQHASDRGTDVERRHHDGPREHQWDVWCDERNVHQDDHGTGGAAGADHVPAVQRVHELCDNGLV